MPSFVTGGRSRPAIISTDRYSHPSACPVLPPLPSPSLVLFVTVSPPLNRNPPLPLHLHPHYAPNQEIFLNGNHAHPLRTKLNLQLIVMIVMIPACQRTTRRKASPKEDR